MTPETGGFDEKNAPLNTCYKHVTVGANGYVLRRGNQ